MCWCENYMRHVDQSIGLGTFFEHSNLSLMTVVKIACYMVFFICIHLYFLELLDEAMVEVVSCLIFNKTMIIIDTCKLYFSPISFISWQLICMVANYIYSKRILFWNTQLNFSLVHAVTEQKSISKCLGSLLVDCLRRGKLGVKIILLSVFLKLAFTH